jgi:sugar phosphate isomerase/epimerase
MRFGICTAVTNAYEVKAAGWDYVEENIVSLLAGLTPDDQWKAPALAALPIAAGCVLLPGTLKVVGPEVDFEKLRSYMTTVLARAKVCGLGKLVFGSGVARNIPVGFDREKAANQIIEFARMAAELASHQGITMVLEPLNKSECNVVNSVAEAMRFVKSVDHPSFQCLVDSYHFWLEDEPLENLRRAMPWIKHVHLADKDGRVAPGLSGKADYRPFFRVLKHAGYDDTISFEGTAMTDFGVTAPKVLEFIKRQWSEA